MRKKIIYVFILTILLSTVWVVSAQAEAVLGTIRDAIFYLLETFLKELAESLITAIVSVLMWAIGYTPHPQDVKPMVSGFVRLLIPMYIITIVLSGVHFIFISTSPSGRARAKTILLKLILSMVLVSLSLELYGILLTMASAITHQVFSGTVVDPSASLGAIFLGVILAGISQPPVFIVAGIPLLVVMIAALFSVFLRTVLVLIMAAIFPITLFLYFFDMTKSVGTKLFKYTFMAIFTQPVQAVALAVMVMGVNGMDTSTDFGVLLGLFIAAGGFIMIALAPLMMTGALGVIAGGVAAAGIVVSLGPGKNSALMGGAMTAVGAVGAGMGPGGLVAGGTSYSLGKAYTGAMGPRMRGPPPQQPPSTSRPSQQEPPEDGSEEFT